MSRAMFAILILLLAFSSVSFADDGIWTSSPVRVDPDKQSYERLPGLTMGLEDASSVSFPLRLEMHDSVSFSANGIEYRLKELKPVSSTRLCRSETGSRWPCGAQASIFVSNIFRGKTLICKAEPASGHVALSGCRTTVMRIPQEIVAQGFAFPSGGQTDLEAALASAKLLRAGVWKDISCATAAHSC